MEDKRKNLRRHIKAASDWLQQADKSIERKEDLQGDLKLMLAKAELQSAEKHQNRSCLTKILSFSTAALIALGIFWVNDDSEKVSQLTSSSVSTTKAPDSPILEVNKATDSLSLSAEIPAESNADQENAKEQIESQFEQSSIYESEESDKNDGESEFGWKSNTQFSYSEIEAESITEDLNIYHSEPIPDTTSESYSTSLEVQAPTEDMQKLMQSAGQILHAE